MTIVTLKATDGSDVAFDDKIIGAGGMKDVYFAPDKSYVVAFYRQKQDPVSRDRLLAITGVHRERIFNQAGGDYWKNVLCWPTKIVEHKGLLGLVAPTYQKHFFFQYGSMNNDHLRIRGKEKEGKWFASALHQNRSLDPRERGTWINYVRVCILTSRAVKRLHAAGLAHSDLSYKNVLVDPCGGNSNVIDLDSLVVPGKYPPDVMGTPDFIAPEVMTTQGLSKGDPQRKLPSIQTDRHALSVLIYMYLLYRHPLRGRKVHDLDDATRDEALAMGERALFVENPQDTSNRYDVKWVKENEERKYQYLLPWWDLDALPFTVLGPYIAELCRKAFVEGLHTPARRPTADDWETALVKTVDLTQPCLNPACAQKWFVFDNTKRPVCPFCKTPYRGLLPVLNLYSRRAGGKYTPDNHRLMVYNNQYLYPWHVDRHVFPNEKIAAEQKKPVGYFVFHNNQWLFVNQTLPGLKDLAANKPVPPGSPVVLADGMQLLLSPEEGGRLAQIQMVDAR